MSAFSYPPPFGKVGEYSSDLNFTIGSNVNIQWSGAPNVATLWLFRDIEGITCTAWNLASTYCARILTNFSNTDSYTWNVQTYSSSYDGQSEPYYFVMGPEPPRVSGIAAFDSHYFNILPTAGASSSSSSATSSTSATVATVITSGSSFSTKTSTASSSGVTSSSRSTSSASSGASSSSSHTTASNTAASSSSAAAASSSSAAIASQNSSGPSSSDTGLSTGTKAAIGVAVGVGVPLILLLGYIAWVLSRKSRNKKTAASSAGSAIPAEYQSKTTSAYQGYPELGSDNTAQKAPIPQYSQTPTMSELPGGNAQQPLMGHYELPGDSVRR